jgi:hypothetical protein
MIHAPKGIAQLIPFPIPVHGVCFDPIQIPSFVIRPTYILILMLHILPAYITSIDPGVNDIDPRFLKFTIGIMSEAPGFVAVFYRGKPLVFPIREADIRDGEFEGDECRVWQKLGGRVEIIALEIGDEFFWWGGRESDCGSYYLFDLYE